MSISILQTFAALCTAPTETRDHSHAFRPGDHYVVEKVQGYTEYWFRVYVCPENYQAFSSEKFSQYFIKKG